MRIVTWMGSSYEIPETGEEDWSGDLKVDGLLESLAENALSKAGGPFVLTADANFGGTAGLISQYYKSRSSNIATTGVVRYANNEGEAWRNAANNANLVLKVNSSDQLEFNGNVLNSGTLGPTLGGTGITTYTLGDLLYASAANTLAKLAGNTTTTKKFLNQTGNGTISAAPSWDALVAADIPNLDFAKITTGTVPIAQGGTGQTAKTAAFDALSPMTTLGDLVYGGASGTGTRLAGNNAINYRKSLGQTGAAGPVSAAPAWETPSRVNVVAKTTTYTATTDDEVINCSGSAFTVTLYAAANNAGRRLWIRKTDSTLSNIITIDGNSSETIDGSLTTTLNTQYESVLIECDGSNWFIVERKCNTDWVAYTPTFTGWGTPSSVNFYSRRQGSDLLIRGTFTAGTTTATEIRVNMGFAGTDGNVTSSSAIPTIEMLAVAACSQNSSTNRNILIEASKTYFVFGDANSGSGGFTKGTGNTYLSSGDKLSFSIRVPIDGWKS